MKRNAWIDALRALAMLGVFLVNAMGYPFAPAYPMQLGAPQPIDSMLGIALQSLLVILVQSKAWPLLSFLFGYSLCELAAQAHKRGLIAITALRKRYCKLLVIGIVHGTFLYFGDILTMYALAGILAAAWALQRPSALLIKWKTTLVVASCLEVALVCFTLIYFTTQPLEASNSFTTPASHASVLALNAKTYWNSIGAAVLSLLPIVLMLVLSGVLARRFHLLSQRSYAKKFWQKHLSKNHLVTALSMNLALGLTACIIHFQIGQSYAISLVSTLSAPAGIYLSAAGLAAAMRWRHAQNAEPVWVRWLAPAGSQTLAMYLASSTALLLSSGAFFALNGTTTQRLCVVVFAWGVAIVIAKAASARGWRDPITRYLGR